MLTEDYHAFNKLARAVVGTNNIDSNSRLCMSSAVVGYKQSLGSDAPPCSYEDLDHADCVFIIGANPAWAHPILFRRLEDAKARKPSMQIIVVDPRRTESAEFADLHLQILPGTDVALCHGLLHAMIWEGWVDTAFIEAHTAGFAELKALVRDMPPREAARICGVSESDLLQAARCFATSPASLSLYCMGMNQSSSGTAKNTALINLHLAAAQIGKPGAGPFSLTGQPNAMGGRESGGMATLLPGHRDPENARHRAEIARLWGVESLPEAPGKTAVELFEAAERGEIKALWIRLYQPRAIAARAGAREAGAGALRAGDPAGGLCRHGHRRLCRRPAAGRHLGREGRHGDQQRAAHQPRARRRAAAGPGAAGLADRPRRGPPDGCRAVHGHRISRAAVAGASRSHARAGSGHHRPQLRAAGPRRPAAMALRRGGRGKAWRGCTRTAASPRPTAAPASSPRPTSRRWTAPTRAAR